MASIAQGVTVISNAPNAAVYLGLPFASLEFENPLSGAETILCHKVLEWRDADYAAGPPRWYDDWSVSHPTEIDGNANEIWMRRNGHSIWTTTTVASTIVSIHLNGDSNDGIARVLVDGVDAALLDMYAPACCQTALIIVRDLANTTHTIMVKDLGVGGGGSAADDVATLGAAALQACDIKWDQPPALANPTNVFCGWNEKSLHFEPPYVADDWVCTTTNPVTDIHWWGSFLNWKYPTPPQLPQAFVITFWTDKAAQPPAEPFSHPDVAIWQVYCTNFTVEAVGWDYDPRTGTYEACFKFSQDLTPQEWFYQNRGPTGTNIYWISIAAAYQTPTEFPWGWKTRPRDPTSPAPDDAVRIFAPPAPAPGMPYQGGEPIWWPTPTNSWDMAFELTTKYTSTISKWEQIPDTSTAGIDVNASRPVSGQPYLLADDFRCTRTGPITDIRIWGSWTNDVVPGSAANVTFTLSIHSDIPTNQSTTGYSMPGQLLWLRQFQPGQFTVLPYRTDLQEGWLNPPSNWRPNADHICWQYDFHIDPIDAFTQTNGTIYWLDVQARPPTTGPLFGWKTCVTNWNDDAVWISAFEPFSGVWNRLVYPPGHPRQSQSIDLAFQITTTETINGVKWSQPPVACAPANSYNGWNELSVYGWNQIVADDWVCTNINPVTDIHWWGSFINWDHTNLPPDIPSGFLISIWTDVPRPPTIGGFSHPGTNVWQIYCTNFNWHFAGWDFDPRIPVGADIGNPPEACFKFDQDLLPDEWFHQNVNGLTNIYWVSIAAVYPAGQTPQYPWGWKTRPRDPQSLAPDDAVRIFDPTRPVLGSQFVNGQAIEYPTGTSWDMAFVLTTSTNQCPPPTLICSNLIVECGSAVSPPFAWDNCCNTNLTPVLAWSVTNGNCPWVMTETWKATDCRGQTNTCTRLVTVRDTTPPVITCASNLTVECGAAWNFTSPTASDVCCGTNVTITIVGTVTNLGACTSTYTRTWRATDCCTNSATCSQVVTVRDTTPPVITCASNLTVECGAAWNFTSPTATDVCCGTNVTITIVGTVTNVGACISTYTRTWRATDCCTNSATCSQVVTVRDTTPPVITCASNKTVTAGSAWSFDPPAASDACCGTNVTIAIVSTVTNGTCPWVITRTWRATDCCTNSATCSQTVTVLCLDFGDAPDTAAAPGYPTLLANNGARHVIGPLFMGALVDAEADGQPTANADGDDQNPLLFDDEDGVVFNTALIANVPSTVTVTCSGAGILQGWIDFNADGDWADANEQIIVNWPVVAGANLVPFFVPGLTNSGRTYARFRLSTVTGLGYAGPAPNGEVEDYVVTLEPLKWLQKPDLGQTGVDVDNDFLLADDFLCDLTGPITDIHLWGSFYRDQLPAGGLTNLTFTLAIYSDVPTNAINPYSHPGEPLCTVTFGPGQYQAGLCATVPPGEWWHTPPALWVPQADFNCYQFDFYLPSNTCRQVAGNIYWLAVQCQEQAGAAAKFGVKSSYQQWNDDACWLDTGPVAPVWRPLVYGDGHPFAPRSLDLAFAVSGQPGPAPLDFGDAPDGLAAPGYPTLLVNNGARHTIVPGVFLGANIDAEVDGQPNANATGDDINGGPDDEDGVAFVGTLIPGQPYTIQVTASIAGFLNAWVDFNADRSWAQAGDQIFNNQPLAAGVNPLTFTVPPTATWGTNVFARFRFTTGTNNLGYVGLAANGEVEDYMMTMEPLPQHDLGDAPASLNNFGLPMTAYPPGGPPGVLANFPTALVFPGPMAPVGPIHMQPTNVAFLGANVTFESNADLGPDQDLVNNIRPATNLPDQDGADDGVLFPLTLPHCGNTVFNYTVTFRAPPPPAVQLFVNVWFDWNRDGDWNDTLQCPDGGQAPEWAVQNQLLPFVPGPYPVVITNVSLPFRVWHPSLTNQPIWMRITLAEQKWPPPGGALPVGGEGPLNGYAFGETEDYYITTYDAQETFDFGDAPLPYPTVLPNGARHLIVPGFNLGALIDAEANGLPHPQALGDDLNNTADEDGVTFATPLIAGTQACVNVTLASGPAGGRLDAWLDFNKNGIWGDIPAERIFVNQALLPGLSAGLCFSVPTNAPLGTNFSRFRLSSVGSLTPSGAAQDGEVEDYQVILRQRRPLTNIVITNIVVTNVVVAGVASQSVTVQWRSESNVRYQVQTTATFSNAPPFIWVDVGPEVIGPANTHQETNSWKLERYYRVIAPWVWP